MFWERIEPRWSEWHMSNAVEKSFRLMSELYKVINHEK
jgi:hypothetical protein